MAKGESKPGVRHVGVEAVLARLWPWEYKQRVEASAKILGVVADLEEPHWVMESQGICQKTVEEHRKEYAAATHEKDKSCKVSTVPKVNANWKKIWGASPDGAGFSWPAPFVISEDSYREIVQGLEGRQENLGGKQRSFSSTICPGIGSVGPDDEQ